MKVDKFNFNLNMEKTMSKENIIENLRENMGLTKSQSKEAVDLVLSGIADELKVNGELSLIGFGKFYVKDVPERMGRNPSTGEEMKISASKRIGFKPGKKLKDTVNE